MRNNTGRIIGAASLAALGISFILSLCIVKAAPQTMYVNANVCKIRAGAGENFNTVGLLAKETPVIVLDKAAGKDTQTWYRIDKASLPAELEIDVEECYIRSDLLAEK